MKRLPIIAAVMAQDKYKELVLIAVLQIGCFFQYVHK
jgi:hypothetical protein